MNWMRMHSSMGRENTLRGNGPSALNARKTHCKRGHAFDVDNTRVRPTKSGRNGRECRACQAERDRRGLETKS